MADVARRAGVSVMTVSRVMNGSEAVRPATRRRVEKAVEALGYQANAAARVLAGGRSRTLGVIGVESEQFGPSHMLFGIEDAARRAGHQLTFVTMGHGEDDVPSMVRRLQSSHVDGIIVVAPVRPVVDAVARTEGGLPLVVVGGDPAMGVPTVTIDQTEGARLATQHLLDLGHETVHHVRGPRDWIDANGRDRGWRDALGRSGARTPRPVTGDWGARSGYAAGTRLARNPDVTAVFSANDQMAIGAVRALHDAGRRVPRDVSVVGFDDIPEAAYLVPALTTIRQDLGEVGRRGIELLLGLMDGAVSQHHVVLAAELVQRESTARSHPPTGWRARPGA
jgi:DNA-binding LacI/PurR family transcriptional regulator